MAIRRQATQTIRISRKTYEALRRRADRSGSNPDQVAESLLSEALEARAEARPETEAERVRRIMAERGAIVTDVSEYRWHVDPEADYDKIRAELEKVKLDPPVSETIIRMRHED